MAAVVKPLDQRAVIVEADSPTCPEGAWLPNTNSTLYTNGSYWITDTNGARAELAFTGTEVWFYADKNSDHGTFNAMIDDGPPTTILGYNDQLISQTLLFYARVEPGEHVLSLVNLDKVLGIDYFACVLQSP
ncbi:hypothetical protein BKA62DRAFT_177798 [Auriculariales sp. MPI-PUGE-AT-0066]|nr:hypothetical protein BKA62DRAFT_177798 [Auriculariales sp. MPI-PUGE-AT-0066]